MARLILLDRTVSGNCWRVRLLAGFLGRTLERVEVDILAGENRDPLFLAANPRGQVPVLIAPPDGPGRALVIRDSIAILVWLAAAHGPSWLCETPEERAREQEWLAIGAHEQQAGTRAARGALLFGVRPDGFALDRAQELARRSLAMMEERLAAERWLAAGRPTIADVACYPYASLAGDAGVALEAFPAVCRWLGDFAALPGFRAQAGAESPSRRWPDAASDIRVALGGG